MNKLAEIHKIALSKSAPPSILLAAIAEMSEYRYQTHCPKCHVEIGYDDNPPESCPDCGLSLEHKL